MTNKEAIEILLKTPIHGEGISSKEIKKIKEAFYMAIDSLKRFSWIPIEYRSMTGEERRIFSEAWGIEYCETSEEKMFACPMPDDQQEILISTNWGIKFDTCCIDTDDSGYNYFSLEENGDWDGVNAWMPLPEAYKKGAEE
jgi:hypothetical protein